MDVMPTQVTVTKEAHSLNHHLTHDLPVSWFFILQTNLSKIYQQIQQWNLYYLISEAQTIKADSKRNVNIPMTQKNMQFFQRMTSKKYLILSVLPVVY